jgi:hypothetical protein
VFGFGWLRVRIAEHSTLVLIPPGVLHVRMHIIAKLVRGMLALKTDMLLEMV